MEREILKIAEERTKNMLTATVRAYKPLTIQNALISAYLQGIADLATALTGDVSPDVKKDRHQ